MICSNCLAKNMTLRNICRKCKEPLIPHVNTAKRLTKDELELTIDTLMDGIHTGYIEHLETDKKLWVIINKLKTI